MTRFWSTSAFPKPCCPGSVPAVKSTARWRRGRWPEFPSRASWAINSPRWSGQACFEAGEAKNTYGTGCFLLMNTADRLVRSKHGLLTTAAYKFGNAPVQYALEGSIAIAGALVQWLRDNLGLISTSTEVEVLARSVKDNGGVYFVPAFSGLYAPYWKDNARGVIVGLTRYVGKAHIARAVLEAVAYQTREVLEAMEKDSGIDLQVLRVDGGMVVNDVLMQFQADILNRPVVRPVIKETTALGACYAAGLAVGYFTGLPDLRAKWEADYTWTPNLDEAVRGAVLQDVEEGRDAIVRLVGVSGTQTPLPHSRGSVSIKLRSLTVTALLRPLADARGSVRALNEWMQRPAARRERMSREPAGWSSNAGSP